MNNKKYTLTQADGKTNTLYSDKGFMAVVNSIHKKNNNGEELIGSVEDHIDYISYLDDGNDWSILVEPLGVSVTVNAQGNTQQDLYNALMEAADLIKAGNPSSVNENDSTYYEFEVKGQEATAQNGDQVIVQNESNEASDFLRPG